MFNWGDWTRISGGRRRHLDPISTNTKTEKMTIVKTKPAVPAAEDERSRDELMAELEHLRMELAYLKKLDALVQARQRSAAPKKRK